VNIIGVVSMAKMRDGCITNKQKEQLTANDHNMLGNECFKDGDFKKAIKHYKQAIAESVLYEDLLGYIYFPNDRLFYQKNLAVALFSEHKYDDGLECFMDSLNRFNGLSCCGGLSRLF
jgi:hypothetical protein